MCCGDEQAQRHFNWGINKVVSRGKLPGHLNLDVPSPHIPLAFSIDLLFAVFDEAQHWFDLLQQLVVLLQSVAQESPTAPVSYQQGVLGLHTSPLQEGLGDGRRGQILDGPELRFFVDLLLGLPRAKWAERGAVLVGLWGWERGACDPHCALAAIARQGGLQVGGEALWPTEDQHGMALRWHILQCLQGPFVRQVHQRLVVDSQDDVADLHQATLLCRTPTDEVRHDDRGLRHPLLHQEAQTTDLSLEKAHRNDVGLQLAHCGLWLLHDACCVVVRVLACENMCPQGCVWKATEEEGGGENSSSISFGGNYLDCTVCLQCVDST